MQGLTQRLFSQAREGGHSLSEEHPTSTGASKGRKNNTDNSIASARVWLTYELAVVISLSSVPWIASTHHNPEGKFVFDHTLGILDTWPDVQTRVETFRPIMSNKARMS